MDALWIILIVVLLLAGIAGCIIIRRYESREKPWQVVESEKPEAADADAELKQPDIPVWRDKPTGVPRDYSRE